MKKIITLAISLIPLLSPALVFAKSDWALLEPENMLSLQGKCPGRVARVDLFMGNDSEPIYTSGAACLDGNFAFSDNLLQWKSLPDGKYTVVVNSDKQNTKSIVLKRPVEKAVVPSAPAAKEEVKEEVNVPIVTSPETKFLGAFVALQQSLLDMRQWLSETKYPASVKTGMGMAIDGLDMAMSKVSDMVLFSQGPVEEDSAVAAADIAQTPQSETATPEAESIPVALPEGDLVIPTETRAINDSEPVTLKDAAQSSLGESGGTIGNAPSVDATQAVTSPDEVPPTP